MSWAGTAANETVSFTDLLDAVTTGYFDALATITPSLEQINKSDASSLVSINTAYAPFAAKTSLQLVVKSDLYPIFEFNGAFYYNSDPKGWFGWNTSSNACANYSSASSTTVYWNGSLLAGTVVFIPNCTLDLSTVPYYVIVYSGTPYWVTFSYQYYDSTTGLCAYSIVTIGTCITYTDGYSTSSASDACLAGIPMTGISYIGGGDLCSATQMQTNEFLLEIGGATLWVSVGGQVREATVDSPNVSGIVTFVTGCAAC